MGNSEKEKKRETVLCQVYDNLPHKSESAREARQEAAADLLETPAPWEETENPQAYANASFHNELVNENRIQRPELLEENNVSFDQFSAKKGVTEISTPEAIVIAADEWQKALMSLTPIERDVWLISVTQGWTLNEIAKFLGKSPLYIRHVSADAWAKIERFFLEVQ